MIRFRPIENTDSPALKDLVSASPSTGTQISFTYDYQGDFLDIHRAISPDLHGFIAERGEPEKQIIGAIFGDALQVQWEGEKYPAGYIHNLRVDACCRRQGVATGLIQAGSVYARHVLGEQALIYSAIPEGNVSQALVKPDQFHLTRAIQGGVVPLRRRPPKSLPGVIVRPASKAVLPAVAQGMNTFYQEHNLWDPVTPESLDAFLAEKVQGISPNEIYIAVQNEKVLAGLTLADHTKLIRMRIAGLPGFARMLGSILGLLSGEGLLLSLSIRRVWYQPGELEAARTLWETLRYTLRNRGTCLGIAYDPLDLLGQVFRVPRWLPMFKAHYVVQASKPPDPGRMIYCVAGP